MISAADMDKAVKVLAKEDEIHKIILFGSYARGDAGPESDVDFLLVTESVEDPRVTSVRMRRLLSPLRIPVDIVVTKEEIYRKWLDTSGSFFSRSHSKERCSMTKQRELVELFLAKSSEDEALLDAGIQEKQVRDQIRVLRSWVESQIASVKS